MPLTKRKELGSIEILIMGQIQIRTDTIIEEDGKEVSRTYHRHVCTPDCPDITKEDMRVQDIAAVVHTAQVKSDWAAFKAASESQAPQ